MEKKKYVYIKRGVNKPFIEFDEPLKEEEYNNIGSTWQDYLDDLWVQLSNEQMAFHDEHPNASVKEVFDMETAPPFVRTIEQAKIEKKHIIEIYDSSNAINSFIIKFSNGDTIETWITPGQRANYKNSLDSAELLGLEEVHPIFNGRQLTLPTQLAKRYLAMIQLYADRCYVVTETHKANVQSLDTVEAVDNYDNTANYPNKLELII